MTINSRFYFILMAVGTAIGIGNIFIYSYLQISFSASFLIAYAAALLVLGAPLLMLEFSIGQYFNKNVVDLFSSVRKWFSSIGWLMVINSFILMSIYAVAMAWHVIYFFVSFGLQWKNSPRTYFFSNVLQISDGFTNFSQLSLPVFIALIVTWLVIFLAVRNGYGSIRKYFLAFVPALIALLLFFMFYVLSLENVLHGIYTFTKFKFAELLSPNIWLKAFSLAALSLGVGFGVMNVVSRKSEKCFVIGNSFIVIIFELLVGIMLSFIILGMIGFLSAKQNLSLAFSDYGSLLVALTQALPFFYYPTLLSMLFFVLLALLFILAASGLAYSIGHVLVHKFNSRHMHAAILVCGLGFIFGLLFTVKPGYYIIDILLHFLYYNILIALLLECIAIGWFFDSEKISAYINQYSVVKLGALWRFMVRYSVPLILAMMIVLQLRSDLIAHYKNYPVWALIAFGAGAVAVPLVVAFLMPQKILDRR